MRARHRRHRSLIGAVVATVLLGLPLTLLPALPAQAVVSAPSYPEGFWSCTGASCPSRDNSVNVFVGGDMHVAADAAAAGGPVVVLGSFDQDTATGSHYFVGGVGQGGPEDGRAAMEVGGNLTVASGQALALPNPAHKGLISGIPSSGLSPGEAWAQEPDIPAQYAAAKRALTNLSHCWDAQPTTGIASTTTFRTPMQQPPPAPQTAVVTSAITFAGDGVSATQVFDYSESIGTGPDSAAAISFTGIPEGATVVVNLNSPSQVQFSSESALFPGVQSSRLLWNVPRSPQIDFEGYSPFSGHVLIGNPDSDSLVDYPAMNGRYYTMGSLTHGASGAASGNTFHEAAFDGLPGCSAPVLHLAKASTAPDYRAIGDTIEYTITVTNTGNADALDLVVTDDQADVNPVPCTGGANLDGEVDLPDIAPGGLSPDGVLTCTATRMVSQADLDAGSVVSTSTATASGPDGNTITSPPARVTVPAVGAPVLAVDQTPTTAGFGAVGDVIDYTITVTNTGSADALDVEVTQIPSEGGSITCTGGADLDGQDDRPDLAPGAAAPDGVLTCTAQHAVTQADLDAGAVTSTASASATGPAGLPVTAPTDSTSVPGSGAPVLLLDKTTSTLEYSAVGDVIDYTMTVRNTGTVSAFDVSVTDGDADPGSIRCTGPNLDAEADLPDIAPGGAAPNGVISCTAHHTVTQSDLDAGTVTNIAYARGTNPHDGQVVSPPDSVTIPAAGPPSVTLLAQAPINLTPTGADLVGTVATTRNAGALDVAATLYGPYADAASITCAPGTRAGTATGQQQIPPGGGSTDTTAVRVTQPGVYQWVASAGNAAISLLSHTCGDPDATVAVTLPSGKATITPQARPAALTPMGADLVDTVAVAGNTGPVEASATLFGPYPDAASITCAAGTEAGTATGLAVIPNGGGTTDTTAVRVLESGLYTWVAATTGNADTLPARHACGLADQTVAVTLAPDLELVHTTAAAEYSGAGDVIEYRIAVTNTGNLAVLDVAVGLDHADPGSLVCSGGSDLGAAPNAASTTDLAPGEVATCTARITVIPADIDAGSITTVASASGVDPRGRPVDPPTSTATVPLASAAELDLRASTTSTGFGAVGDVIAAQITVTNNGHLTVYDVQVAGNPGQPGCTGGSDLDAQGDAADLAVGAVLTCSVEHPVTQEDLDTGSVTVFAEAEGTDPGGRPVVPPKGSLTVPVAGPAAAGPPMLKTSTTTSTPGFDEVGDVIAYVITVTNIGTSDVGDVAVTSHSTDPGSLVCGGGSDLDGDGDEPDLAVAQVLTCTAEHTVTPADLQAGQVVDTATATGTDSEGRHIIDTGDGPTVPVAHTMALEAKQTPSTADYGMVGDVVRYAITVTNTNDVTLYDVAVAVDNVDPGMVCSGGADLDADGDRADLAPGGLLSCAATRTITQADLDAGQVVTSARATGFQPGGEAVVGTVEEAVVHALGMPRLVTVMTGSTQTFGEAGDVIEYAITVTNTGDVTVYDVAVTDDHADPGRVCSGGLDLDAHGDLPDLAPGETLRCAAQRTVTHEDVLAKRLVSIASATATAPGGEAITYQGKEVAATGAGRP